MKRIKSIKGLVIFEATEKELSKDEHMSKYHIYIKDSLEHGIEFADLEWECDTLTESIEWIKSY